MLRECCPCCRQGQTILHPSSSWWLLRSPCCCVLFLLSALKGHGKCITVSSDNRTERYFRMHARPFANQQHHDKASKKDENDYGDGDDDGVYSLHAAVNEERLEVRSCVSLCIVCTVVTPAISCTCKCLYIWISSCESVNPSLDVV